MHFLFIPDVVHVRQKCRFTATITIETVVTVHVRHSNSYQGDGRLMYP